MRYLTDDGFLRCVFTMKTEGFTSRRIGICSKHPKQWLNSMDFPWTSRSLKQVWLINDDWLAGYLWAWDERTNSQGMSKVLLRIWASTLDGLPTIFVATSLSKNCWCIYLSFESVLYKKAEKHTLFRGPHLKIAELCHCQTLSFGPSQRSIAQLQEF